MKNYAKPIIERFYDDCILDERQRNNADAICRYLSGNGNETALEGYYEAVTELLTDGEHERILFYLPFEELQNAPVEFRTAYLTAWHHLMTVYDVRENFHFGDTFEPDARPNGELERVVKAAHLIPWLLKAGYITLYDVADILRKRTDEPILIQSVKDTLPYIRDKELVRNVSAFDAALLMFLQNAETIPRAEPLYTSEKRANWLKEMKDDQPAQMLTPKARLEGPFTPNIRYFQKSVDNIENSLAPNEIALVGGSRLKGYGTTQSDIDVYGFESLMTNPKTEPGTAESINIYFNMLWLGGSDIGDVSSVADNVLRAYQHTPEKLRCLEELEIDLLQYRLLHKGFARHTGQRKFETSCYKEIDGDCPFYERSYRRIATMLFAKYVRIPT